MPDGRGERRPVDERANLAEMTMRLRLRNLDVKLECRNSAHGFAPGREPVSCDLHRLHCALEFSEIRTAIQNRADDHVATEAGERVEVSRFHRATFTW